MRQARVEGSGRIYNAVEFKELSSDDRKALKGRLKCIDCGAKAHYKEPKKVNRKPHFGANEHLSTCTHFGVRKTANLLETAVLTRSDATGLLVIRRISDDSGGERVEWEHDPLAAPRDGSSGSGGDISATDGSLNLSSLLHKLATDDDYRHSPQLIRTLDGRISTIADYCVVIDPSTDESYVGKERFYWGVIKMARLQWIFSVSGSPRLTLPSETFEAVLARLGTTKADLSDQYFGVIGIPVPHPSSRMEIVVSDPGLVSVSRTG